jgi:hypothetical protein
MWTLLSNCARLVGLIGVLGAVHYARTMHREIYDLYARDAIRSQECGAADASLSEMAARLGELESMHVEQAAVVQMLFDQVDVL